MTLCCQESRQDLQSLTRDTEAVPLVSVVIPAYNAQATLAQTLDSIVCQDWPAVEVIVVDDGSVDGTWGVLQQAPVPVRVVRQANAGLAAARNAGLALARGRFIALLDADDLCAPTRLSTQVACLMAYPEMALCCSDFSAFNEHGSVSPSYGAHYYGVLKEQADGIDRVLAQRAELRLPGGATVVLSHGQAYAALVQGNFVHPPTLMFRRSVLEQVGEFDTTIGSMCDWDWIVRAAQVGEVGYLHQALLDYRLSATQMSSARYRVRAQVDIVRVGERLVARDPALLGRGAGAFRRVLGQWCLNAADALADSQPRRAAWMLWRAAWRYRTLNRVSVRIGLKCWLPPALMRWVRQRRPVPGGFQGVMPAQQPEQR